MVMAKNLQAKKEAEQSRIKAKTAEMKCGMTSVWDKMSETNRKEMLAGLFLSKFNTRDSKAGLERLGYATLKEAYKGLAELVGGNPLSVRNYRDEFDPVFPNGRNGYNKREMHPTRKAMMAQFGWMEMEEMAEVLEEQFLGAEKFTKALDKAFDSSVSGADVAAEANRVKVSDTRHFAAGDFDPTSVEGKERIAQTRIRITQSRFRKWILSIYGQKCCITGLAIPELLQASHISGWNEDPVNRMNPSNGLCLSATYHVAFDKYLIAFDDDYRMVLSKSLREFCTNEIHKRCFLSYEGKKMSLPDRFLPDKGLLEQHRERVVK